MTTTIEWTQRPGTKGETWNPTRGCSLTSPGCTNCYAMRQAHRFSGKGGPYHGLTKLRKKGGPVWTGKVRLEEDMLDAPLHWREPRTVFVNSMSDLFHERLTNEEIAAVFGVMAACPQHTFQILTKRATRMREWFKWHKATVSKKTYAWEPWRLCESEAMERVDNLPAIGCESRWPLDNVWLGVSVENQEYANERMPDLVKTPARVRFVSYEPALGPVDLSIWMYHGVVGARPGDDDYDAIDQVIVGGESGPGARPFDVAWASSMIEQCRKAKKACFVKQMGKWTFGSAEGFEPMYWMRGTRDAWYTWCPPIIGEAAHKAPSDAIGFSLGGKGGDPTEWPESLRVREYPEVRA